MLKLNKNTEKALNELKELLKDEGLDFIIEVHDRKAPGEGKLSVNENPYNALARLGIIENAIVERLHKLSEGERKQVFLESFADEDKKEALDALKAFDTLLKKGDKDEK